MKYNFYMPTPDQGVIHMLTTHGHTVSYAGADINKTDIAIFVGGEDVHPFLYGEDILKTTKANIRRDKREVVIYRKLPLQMPKVGICRGAQFLNIMSGGGMYQHVDNHTTTHEAFCTFNPGEVLQFTSTHHQMMKPSNEAWIMWGSQECHRVETDSEILDVGSDPNFEEAEVVYYGHTNSLCFQPHPEFNGFKPLTDMFFSTLDEMFKKDVEKRRETLVVKQIETTQGVKK